MVDTNGRPASFAIRLQEATNSHDVDRVADCFTADYLNETPVHPARGFRGREQVRRNWAQIFALVPDITATVLDTVEKGDTVWSEWEMRGHRADGGEHLMRGSIIFSIEADGDHERARSARFYLEPVDRQDVDADHALQQVLRDSAS
jgi:ketosteroid isomerase-like protein